MIDDPQHGGGRLTMAALATEQARLEGEISGHQRECVEFRRRIEAALANVAKDVTQISDRVDKWQGAAWCAAGSAALMALTLMGWMVLQIWPPSPRPQSPVTVYQSQAAAPTPAQMRQYESARPR